MDERFEKRQKQIQEQLSNMGDVGPKPAPTVQERLNGLTPIIKQNLPLQTEMPQIQDVLGSKPTRNIEAIDLTLDHQETEGELSIPVDHTTAAHKLLMWPSIKSLLHPVVYDEEYVMRLEEERGLISIYGQGETSYTADDSQFLDNRSISSNMTKPQGNGAGSYHDVKIDEFGNLKLDTGTARRYYNSYLEHMFKLHPFVMEGELNVKVGSFIGCYARPGSNDTRLSCHGPPSVERKPSNENLGVYGEFTDNPPRPRVGKNIDNALVMLCLALGAICETRAPLPGPISQPIPSPRPPFTRPPTINETFTHGILSPSNSDSTAMQVSNSHSVYAVPMHLTLSFPLVLGPHLKGVSRRDMTTTRDEQGNTKNHQVIPSLALYGYATAILGYLQGGNDLEHIHTALLAGLYAGQLAHPFQSHSWISQACRACQVLVRTKRHKRLEEGPTRDLHNFAYWTCLQLESDLLAELDIPASGISLSEDRIPIPKGKWSIVQPNDPQNTMMMMLFYSAQIHLRKLLNRVHTYLYKSKAQGKTNWSSTVQGALSLNLDLWRKSLPPSMQWEEADPPANEINAARMRAKYYGARYIIHRPFLYHALHYGHTGIRIGPVGQLLVDSPPSPRISTDWQSPEVRLNNLPKKLRAACDICVKSAIKCTEVFDGVDGDRLIVTNIFGTAHA